MLVFTSDCVCVFVVALMVSPGRPNAVGTLNVTVASFNSHENSGNVRACLFLPGVLSCSRRLFSGDLAGLSLVCTRGSP